MPDAKPTQQFVPVKEVREGVIILKEGGYRGVLMCSSINFALKSDSEQQAVIRGFQTFLNTLDFSVEILVHSRKMDIRPYLALLEERMAEQQTELMRIQLREYIAFIKNFTEGTSIMTKLFYIVVPYEPGGNTSKMVNSLPFLDKGAGKGGGTFDEHRAQLSQRMTLVSSGLISTGLRAIPLGTEEVIELLYRSFNLGELETPIRLPAK